MFLSCKLFTFLDINLFVFCLGLIKFLRNMLEIYTIAGDWQFKVGWIYTLLD